MFSFFRRRKRSDDKRKLEFVSYISGLLKVQMVLAPNTTLENPDGRINSRAIGYVYGFIDAGLTAIGQDMTDSSISVPITFMVMRKVFPGREDEYVDYLIKTIGHDDSVMLGAMKGGQQFVDFSNGKLRAPMGLARFLIQDSTSDLG